MARAKFDEKYVFAELEKVGDALASPVTLYLIGGAAMIKHGLKAATKLPYNGMAESYAHLLL